MVAIVVLIFGKCRLRRQPWTDTNTKIHLDLAGAVGSAGVRPYSVSVPSLESSSIPQLMPARIHVIERAVFGSILGVVSCLLNAIYLLRRARMSFNYNSYGQRCNGRGCC